MEFGKPVRVAIIGQGRSGRDIHGSHFLADQSGHYKVVAVVDSIEYRRERAVREFGCDSYADYRSLFARHDIDLVVNASFSYQHAPITMDLLTHGYNVLSEKPFAMHSAECDALIEAANRSGTVLAVFQNSRFAPYYRKLHEVLFSGILGDIVQISLNWSGYSRRWDWQCCQRFGGGSLYNTCPHPLDQALDLLGWDSDVTVAFSKLRCCITSGDAEDYVKMILTAPGKPVVDLECSSLNPYAPWFYVVHGTHGSLRAKADMVEWKYYIPELEPPRPLILTPLEHEDRSPAYCSEALTWYDNSFSITKDGFAVACAMFYENLYRHLTLGEPLEVKPEHSRKQIALMEEVHEKNPLPVVF